jgi:hypothetical protein
MANGGEGVRHRQRRYRNHHTNHTSDSLTGVYFYILQHIRVAVDSGVRTYIRHPAIMSAVIKGAVLSISLLHLPILKSTLSSLDNGSNSFRSSRRKAP